MPKATAKALIKPNMPNGFSGTTKVSAGGLVSVFPCGCSMMPA